MAATINSVPNDPTLADALDLWKRQTELGLNCHHIGSIVTFDPSTQTATVKINYVKTFFQPNSVSGNAGPPNLVPYPTLVNCPVIVLGGGTGYLTFPILPGDECLILFNDRDIDTWFTTGALGAPVNTGRLHSTSDAIALVGIRSTPHQLSSYDSVNIVLALKGGVKAVFGQDGSFTVTNTLGSFNFKATGELTFSTGPAGVTADFTATGQVKFTNVLGELIQSLYNIITTATAAGFPLIISPADLAVLTSFL